MGRIKKEKKHHFSPLAEHQRSHVKAAAGLLLKIRDVRFIRVGAKSMYAQFKVTLPKLKKPDSIKQKFNKSKLWITVPIDGHFKSVHDDSFLESLDNSLTNQRFYPADNQKPNARIFLDEKAQEVFGSYRQTITDNKKRRHDIFDVSWNDARAKSSQGSDADFDQAGIGFFHDDFVSKINGFYQDNDLSQLLQVNNIRLSLSEAEVMNVQRGLLTNLSLCAFSLGVNSLKYSAALFFALTTNWWAGKAFKDGLEIFGIPTSLQSKNKWYWHNANHYIYAPRVKLTAG